MLFQYVVPLPTLVISGSSKFFINSSEFEGFFDILEIVPEIIRLFFIPGEAHPGGRVS